MLKKKIPRNINPVSINDFKTELTNNKIQSVKFDV